MREPVERRFRVNGLDMSALEWPGDGLPVIALHGWLDNAASFLPLGPLLEGVHLLVPDLPGHGRSGHLPASAAYHLSDNCRWVAALADAMGWQRFALLGHSMGAAAASITAAAMPQRVSGLVLIDGLGPLAFTPEQEVARLRQLFSVPYPSGARTFPDIESAVKVRRRLGRFPISEQAARPICERGMVQVEGGYRWSHDERLSAPSTHYYSPEQSEAILSNLESQTLLISADNGALQGWSEFGQRRACVAQLRHETLAGGHHLHMEHAEEVAGLVNRFLLGLQEEAA